MGQQDLVRATGIGRQRVYEYYHGQKTPGADTAFAIADALGIQTRWLIRGEGPRDLDPYVVDEDGWVWLPHYDLFAFEGIQPPKKIEDVPVSRAWLLANAKTVKGLWVTEMPNDAMPDVAPTGEFIICGAPDDPLRDRRVYAFLIDGRPMIRRAEFRSGGLILTAQNPAVEPITPSPDQIEFLPIGRVIASIKMLAV